MLILLYYLKVQLMMNYAAVYLLGFFVGFALLLPASSVAARLREEWEYTLVNLAPGET